MVHVLNTEEIKRMRESGRINGMVHAIVRKALEAGIATMELNHLAASAIREAGAVSSIRDAFDFPGDICISINDEIGHGIPGERRIQDGDVVKVDISIAYEGIHTDAARTHVVGSKIRQDVLRLQRVATEALQAGIAQAVSGNRCSDISHAIFSSVQEQGLTIVRHAFGHGIGLELHQAPPIPNFGPRHLGPRLRAGMALAIEPVVCLGQEFWGKKKDGWTEVTLDGQVCAHEEHTVLITEDIPEVLTRMPEEDDAWMLDGVNGEEGEKLSRSPVFAMTGLHLRRMEEDDKRVILSMAAEAMDQVLIAAWGRKVSPADLFPAYGETRILVGNDGEVLGFFTVEPRDREQLLHLTTLVIGAARRGAGVGKAVMAYIEQWACAYGFNRVQLCVQTTNPRAIRFYEQQGYRHSGAPLPNTLLMHKRV